MYYSAQRMADQVDALERPLENILYSILFCF